MLLAARVLLLSLWLSVPQPVAVSTAQAEEGWVAEIDEARLRSLAEQPQWHKLMRYRTAFFSRTGMRSDIHSASYFLSPEGREDPAAELRATLEGMLEPIGEEPDDHPQCRFPARLAWLRSQINWPPGALVATCPGYQRWSRSGRIASVSVVLASGHLSNPASFYGHLLLKFNAEGESVSDDLLATSMNYGAVVPEGESALVYVTRGLFGGYDSSFSHLEYFYYEHNYAESELRDLWEYRLDLRDEEVDFLVAHSWEVLGSKNTYYFLKQNCAYRIAELLNVVIERPLLPPSKPWSMPIDVFQRLAETPAGERDLVASIRLWPSRQSTFGRGFQVLTPEGRAVVLAYVGGGGSEIEPLISELDAPAQASTLEVLLNYYALVEADPERVTPDTGKRKNKLLRARLERPPRSGSQPSVDDSAPPHLGQRSSLIQLGSVYNTDLGPGVVLRFRAAFHDLLSLEPGTLPGAELSVVDAELLLRGKQASLRRLDILKVSTLNLSHSGLPHDGGNAWGFRFGFQSRDLSCDRCLVGFLEGGFGRGVQIERRSSGYALLMARTTVLDNQGSVVQLGAKAGFLVGAGSVWKAVLEGGLWQQLDGRQHTIPFARFENRFGSSSRWDIRAAVAFEEAAEVQLSFSLYW